MKQKKFQLKIMLLELFILTVSTVASALGERDVELVDIVNEVQTKTAKPAGSSEMINVNENLYVDTMSGSVYGVGYGYGAGKIMYFADLKVYNSFWSKIKSFVKHNILR